MFNILLYIDKCDWRKQYLIIIFNNYEQYFAEINKKKIWIYIHINEIKRVLNQKIIIVIKNKISAKKNKLLRLNLFDLKVIFRNIDQYWLVPSRFQDNN